MLYGARIFAAAVQGHLTWDAFWSELGWALCLGSAVPGLVMLGLADFSEDTQWWQVVLIVVASLVICIMGYRLFTA
jgi:hypothetical protein